MSYADMSASQLAKEYGEYYDTCEKRNQFPLPFREWLDKMKAQEKNKQ